MHMGILLCFARRRNIHLFYPYFCGLCLLSILFTYYVSVYQGRWHDSLLSVDVRPWNNVTGDLFIYSSYWENRLELQNTPYVKTVALMRYQKALLEIQGKSLIRSEIPFDCYLWYFGETAPVKGHVSASQFDEAQFDYVGVFINCHPLRPLKVDRKDDPEALKQEKPTAVSITCKGCPLPSVQTVIDNVQDMQPKRPLLVCVRPMFGPYDNIDELALFLAYYRYMGVQNFQFYVESASPKVLNFLKKADYRTDISIFLVSWSLPVPSNQVWDHGSLTALNDCVYQNMRDYTYILQIDLDELIVPTEKKHSKNFSLLISDLSQATPDTHTVPGSFVFSNTFYCEEFPRLNVSQSSNRAKSFNHVRGNITAFSSFLRTQFQWVPGVRSKVVMRPSVVESVGHHWVYYFTSNTKYINKPVPPDMALMHHYRKCEGIRTGQLNNGHLVVDLPTKEDYSLIKISGDLIESDIMKLRYDVIS